MTIFKKFSFMIIVLSALLMVNPVFATPESAPVPVGKVVWVKGTFKAVMENKEERTLQKASVVYLNDTLVTLSDAQAQIVFTDNTLMTFREGTTFYIDEYKYTPKAKGSVGKYVMKLIEGGFRTITGLIAKSNPSDYQVNTPVATIGVRGTDYTVYVHKGEIYIGQYSGEPCVQGKKGTQVCLNKETRYGTLQNGEAVPMSQRPDVFKQDLKVEPAKIGLFSAAGGGAVGPSRSVGGTVSSFCIQ